MLNFLKTTVGRREVGIGLLGLSYAFAAVLAISSQIFWIRIYDTPMLAIYVAWILILCLLFTFHRRLFLWCVPQLPLVGLPIWEFVTQANCPERFTYCIS